QQVLPEAALLALEHVGDRLQRPVARAGDRTSTTAVVEQRVDGLLQHPLLVVHDDLGRAEVAKRPPSSCTIGRRSGGMTGTQSSTMPVGEFFVVRNAETTLSRFRARV